MAAKLCMQNVYKSLLKFRIHFVYILYTICVHFVYISCIHLVQFLYTKYIHDFRVGQITLQITLQIYFILANKFIDLTNMLTLI